MKLTIKSLQQRVQYLEKELEACEEFQHKISNALSIDRYGRNRDEVITAVQKVAIEAKTYKTTIDKISRPDLEKDRLWYMMRLANKDPMLEKMAEEVSKIDRSKDSYAPNPDLFPR